MRLFFIRHAAAAARDTWTGDDSARPLTKDGAKKMRQSAKGLKKLVKKIDLIITSPALRAVQTAEILGDIFKKSKHITSVKLEPGSSYLDFLKLMEEIGPDPESVALVGHEPDLSLILSALLTGDADSQSIGLSMRADLRKSGCAEVQLAGVRATLINFFSPSVLRKLGG